MPNANHVLGAWFTELAGRELRPSGCVPRSSLARRRPLLNRLAPDSVPPRPVPSRPVPSRPSAAACA